MAFWECVPQVPEPAVEQLPCLIQQGYAVYGAFGTAAGTRLHSIVSLNNPSPPSPGLHPRIPRYWFVGWQEMREKGACGVGPATCFGD